MTYPETSRRFDWPTEFPEVFTAGKASILAADSRPAGFTAIVGNPPFLGGQKLRSALGREYVEHLVQRIALGRRGSADLAAFFWLRAHELVSERGFVGVVATNTLLQGATHRVGLGLLNRRAWTPYRLVCSRPWPSASAAVEVCLVWTARIGWVDPRFRDVSTEDEFILAAADPRHAALPIYPGDT